ncbi:MAG: protease HtpX [Candidatus Melainabacteria bacterium]|nr:protease HtpX [Candidatus Melainabacteria bacterium]
MSIAKRIFLFIGLNILIITTISVLLAVFNVQPYLTQYGLDYVNLAIFCLIWGMGGAFISLALSRAIAKWSYGITLINPATSSAAERQLIEMVHGLCRKAGLEVMPEIGIYQSDEVNAFATGPTKSRALVAVSSGLLNNMTGDEIEGVLGHEVSHITNGDMVTMTLLQGVVNAFVMFLSRVIAYVVTRGDKDSRGVYWIVTFVLQTVFLILGSMLIALYSRHRETRADEASAQLGGREKMIRALEALKRTQERLDPRAQPAMQTLKISTEPKGIWRFFATHPPLDERIAHLRGEG